MTRSIAALTLAILAACAPATRRAPAPAPAPEPAPAPSARTSTSAARAAAQPAAAGAGSADTTASYRVPPFRPLPLVKWGAPPPGVAHPVRVPTYDLRHQIIHVHFDWARHAVVGSTTLRLAALDTALREVRLNAVDMHIGSVRGANGRPLRYDYDGKVLMVHLAHPVRPRAVTSFTVAYETIRPKKGAYFVDRKHIVWTQGEMIDTRFWIPTYDEPNDKTTWEMYITTPRGERALSNGKLIGSRPVPGGIEWHWSLDKPASTYLMTAATGNYIVLHDHWRNVPVDYWTYPDSVQAAWRGFGMTPKAIALFSAKTGVPYPWVKYDQVVAPDYIFGGMENVTATTQLDDGILHPKWATPQMQTDGLVSHELGHQWYGDMLTLDDWGDAWLNEGFATFMQQTYTRFADGRDASALDRLGARQQTIEADIRARRPLVWNHWAVDPLEVFFSGHIYPRGATVLQMLRHQLGDSLFWVAMHHYTVQHEYGNVVSADLRDAFEQTTGRNFHPFFKQWVYGAGYPLFQVSYQYDSAGRVLTLEARQTQPVDSMTGLFDADVDVQVLTDSGPVNGVVHVRGKVSHGSIALKAPPRAIRWNKGGWLLQVADFPRPTVMLAYELAHGDGVAGRIEAIERLEERPAEAMALASVARAARHDEFWGVRARAVRALRAFAPESAARAAVLDASRDTDARVRQRAATVLASFPGAASAKRLEALARGDSSLFVRGAALRAFARADSDAALPLVRDALTHDSWMDIQRTGALEALADVHGATARAIVRPYLGFSVSRPARVAAIHTLVALSRKGHAAEAAAQIAPDLDAPDFFTRAAAAGALGRLRQASSIPALEARLKVEAESRVINVIDAALAHLRGAS